MMPIADELYLLLQQAKDLSKKGLNQFDKYFDWLEDVSAAADGVKGGNLFLKTPGVKKGNKSSLKKSDNKDNQLEDASSSQDENSLQEPEELSSNDNSENSDLPVFKLPSTHLCSDTSKTLPNEVKRTSRARTKKRIQNSENQIENENVDVTTFKEPNLEIQIESSSESDSEVIKKTKKKGRPSKALKNKDNIKKADSIDSSNSTVTDIEDGTTETETLETPIVLNIEGKENESWKELLPTKPLRTTRTKKRDAEEVISELSTSKKSKRIESDKSLIDSSQSDSSEISVVEEPLPTVNAVMKEHIIKLTDIQSNTRVTRSKIRPAKTSPIKEPIVSNNEREFSPKKINANLNKLVASPKIIDVESVRHSPLQLNIRMTRSKARKPPVNSTDDKALDAVERSPLKPVNPVLKYNANIKHMGSLLSLKKTNKNILNADGTQNKGLTPLSMRLKPSQFTPLSLKSSSTSNLLGSRGLYNSGNLLSSYSRKRTPLLNLSPRVGSKKLLSVSENKGPSNIMVGPSFLTKVHPTAPSKEEAEEQKMNEMLRKREKEAETRKKKAELMRMKAEETKRKNEERMKKVQETREARERKMAEARENQEKVRKERELERWQKNEEAKQLMLKKQLEMKQREEQKQLEKKHKEEQEMKEIKLREEQRKWEEQKLVEEKKQEELRLREKKKQEEMMALEIKKMEEQKKKMEYLKMIELKKAQEKLRLEKEALRIAREKREMEELRQKEEQRLQALRNKCCFSKGNETIVSEADSAMNSTYTKSAEEKTSYDMTPVVIRPPNDDPNDYGIDDLDSGDSTDEDCAPKKKIPLWAKGHYFKKAIFDQVHVSQQSVDAVFPGKQLFKLIDLDLIFTKRRSRFHKRTSSAVWDTPPNKVFQ